MPAMPALNTRLWLKGVVTLRASVVVSHNKGQAATSLRRVVVGARCCGGALALFLPARAALLLCEGALIAGYAFAVATRGVTLEHAAFTPLFQRCHNAAAKALMLIAPALFQMVSMFTSGYVSWPSMPAAIR